LALAAREKSTLIRGLFAQPSTLYINLLKASDEQRYGTNPDLLSTTIARLNPKTDWIIIDEIQKVPKLLDIVHEEIVSHGFRFALTGSSV